MALGRHTAELTGVNITDFIHSIVEVVADRSAYSLGDSQHAPRKGSRDTQYLCRTLGDENNITHLTSSTPTAFSTSPLPRPFHNNTPFRTSTEKPVTMNSPLADVDDTAAFMSAARSFKLEKEYGKPPATSDDASSEQDVPEAPLEVSGDVEAPTDSAYATPEPGAGNINGDVNKLMIDFDVVGTTVSSQPAAVNFRSPSPKSEKFQPEIEDREHLTTFAFWGTPINRDKPAAQVRRVIIKGLPSSWAIPDKVLSLVHGGMIESVSITPSGNAHVVFCDPIACKAFYDKYPNGIDLDKERKFTVFVGLGKDVDVISSQLAFNLSVGSTRVVRAVGVEMGATMSDIVKIATASNRKVEKIIDSYVPGYPRSVSFRFCSIDDAFRFRAALVRNEDWEHCNVQYASDPCEVATGYHAD